MSSDAATYLESIKHWHGDANVTLIEDYANIVASANKLSIFHRIYEQKNAPKALIVLFHGLGSCCSMLGSLANFFKQFNVDVASYDTIGHGRSTGLTNNTFPTTTQSTLSAPDCYIPDYQTLVKVGQEFLQFIANKQRYQNVPIFLYGKSMGGGTILHLMTQQDKLSCKIAGVMLEAPLVTIMRPIPSYMEYSLRLTVTGPDFTNFSRIPEQVKYRSTHKECALTGLCASSAVAMLSLAQELTPQLHKINVPMLICHGTADTVTSIQGSKLAVEKNQHKDKQFKEIEGGFHSLTTDLCVKQVEQVYADWLLSHIK